MQEKEGEKMKKASRELVGNERGEKKERVGKKKRVLRRGAGKKRS